ncbi:MAG: transcriptional repressor LexA [Micavibrio aeruginosavorus]|uniref:LexA repressor n=1 Tax=Micavibrio aeruginosavorus TaxID=349221 RepID=A0A7T5R0R7_9BACT|nr:MAG: transcriptional repressor LexA [Micavibrio aeruginosavorus]
MLTRKQKDLLLFIHERMQQGDVAPSFEEMKEALGLKSKSGIHRLISALVERGYLERLPHRARALEVRKLPEGYSPAANDTTTAASVSRNIRAVQNMAEAASTVEIVPLYGKIAAGTPIEALRDETASIEIPPSMLGRGEHYALTIAGDSMINAGINDGDTVIIQKCDTAENGAIVVALVDDHEATLKRIRRSGNKIILEPENDQYEPRVLEPGRVKVQGRLVSLMRTYH